MSFWNSMMQGIPWRAKLAFTICVFCGIAYLGLYITAGLLNDWQIANAADTFVDLLKWFAGALMGIIVEAKANGQTKVVETPGKPL